MARPLQRFSGRQGSAKRACSVLLFDISSYHYKSRRTGQAALEKRGKEMCEAGVRYGYRRVHVLLRREGWLVNMKKTCRIYKELGLQLRNKTPKLRVNAKLREDRQEAVGPNDICTMNFVHAAKVILMRTNRWLDFSFGNG